MKAGLSSSRGMLVQTGKLRRCEGDRLYNGWYSSGDSDFDSVLWCAGSFMLKMYEKLLVETHLL